MPANYRPRGGGGPGGRYFNNGSFPGPRPSYRPPPLPSHKLAPRNVNKPPIHSPQKKPIPPPKKEVSVTPPVPKPAPIKQEVKMPKAKDVNPTTRNFETNDAGNKVKKFTQRSRLFVGNLPSEVTDNEFKDIFKKYGEVSETFVHTSKGFGFVRLDTRANAERAKLELDGNTFKGRDLKIRFASHGAALSLKHLSPYVSNELLESAFGRFGTVERAVVISDDRGRSTGRGIVEFARKTAALKALSQISEGCFLLTSSPQAIVAKPLDQEDTEDGLPERNIHKTSQYTQEREAPPRFSLPGTFEHEFALRWKALDEMERQQQQQLDKNISTAREKLEIEMENAIHEHKTMLMKQELIRRQEELSRIEDQRQRDLERRKQLEYEREDRQQKELEALAKRQEILRAQVEGTYPPVNEPSLRGPRGSLPAGFGGPPPMMRDVHLDYMGGGPGQGGLGPAPNSWSHSSKLCPISSSNIKKIIGTSGLVKRDQNFYDLVTKFEDPSSKECKRKDCDEQPKFFTLLRTCPELPTCQTIGSWKFEMLTCKINRMFAQRSLKEPKLILYFLPIGPFPDFIHEFNLGNLSLMEFLGEFLKSFFFGSKLKFLPEVDISDIPARNRNHELTGKLQYHVSDILLHLQKKLPPDGFAIIGLSWYDLYPSENLNFILGQGSCAHSACVASFGRFDPNFVKGFKGREDGILPNEMKDITEIDGEVVWKLLKILSHETCHVLGLSHCTMFECLMNESKSSAEALSQPLYLCPMCMSKIQHIQIVLTTDAKSDDTVSSHLSCLHQFLVSNFDSGCNLKCKKLEETKTWLCDMIQYIGQ